MDTPRTERQGFTLIELLIVITILALLAALLIPTLGRAQAKAFERDCVAKCKAIAVNIKVYSMNWGGWTNPDPEFFTALMRPTEANRPGDAGMVEDFRCPAETGQLKVTARGFKVSYEVLGLYAGGNLTMDSALAGQRAVQEINANHKAILGYSGKEGMVRTVAFADGGAQIYIPKAAIVNIVRIQYKPGESGGFGEVEVMDFSGKNLVLNKPVTTNCGYWDNNWLPQHATDGRTNPASPPGAHPGNGHAGIALGCKWDIDLGTGGINLPDVKEVRIWPRGDGCCPNQIDNKKVQFLTSDNQMMWEGTTMQGTPYVIKVEQK